MLYRVRDRVRFWSLLARSKLRQFLVTNNTWRENYPKIDSKNVSIFSPADELENETLTVVLDKKIKVQCLASVSVPTTAAIKFQISHPFE